MIIGDRLRSLRAEKKLSQGDMKKRTGLFGSYVSRVENGHTVPSIETLEKMARAGSTNGVLRGSLSQMNVIDLVQSLEMGRKSCLLTLTNEKERCEMYFTEGQVVHAAYGSLTGDEAVFKVLRWMGGNFQIDFEGKTTAQTTRLRTQGLLMEGLRLLDESRRDLGQTEEEDVLLDT